MRLYNFLTRKIQTFKPSKDDTVHIYACGPTVYNFAHIGNLRTYIFEDVLHRTIEENGYKVKMIMNITDVEDKIIRDAKKTDKSIFEFVRPYEKAFFEDLKKLNIKPADKYPHATKHIKEMVALINKLLARGLAYESNGSIYFDISKFKQYGKLSRVEKRGLKSGIRIDTDEYTKNSARDFVLWKAAKKGEPSWKEKFEIRNSKFEIPGRPGWHVECSAMSMEYLGESFDIHSGGVDLLFPHHENEIAQSSGATGKPFARFFVEGEHLLVEGKKMSKSLGNMFTLRDIEKLGFNPLAFRYLTLTAHYRSKLNFKWASLQSAQNALEKIQNRVLEFKTASGEPKSLKLGFEASLKPSFLPSDKKVVDFRAKFLKAINNDLNTPEALALFWKSFDKLSLDDILWADKILGLTLAKLKPAKIPAKIKKLVQEREKERKEKNWRAADKLRSQINSLGWTIEDTSGKPIVKKGA